MIELLTNVVLIVTGFQLLLLAGVLLSQLPTSLRRNLLAAFLLAKAFLILRWCSVQFELVNPSQFPGFYMVSCAVFLALAPLLYLYIRALCFENFRLHLAHLAHLAPFLVLALLGALGAAILGGFETGNEAVDLVIITHFWDIFWASNLTQILFYIVAMFRVIRRYRRQLADVHSSVARIDLGWVLALLLVISLHWIFVSSRAMLGLLNIQVPQLGAVLDLFSISIFLVFTTVLVVKGLAHVKVFSGIEDAPQSQAGALSEAELKNCSEQVVALMAAEKPHLNSSLSVDELALKLSMPTWQLSRVLNTALGQNFFNFVNSHRVEEAKRQLADPTFGDRKILQILHESGFNSKSTFNDAFKRHTGMTPSEYRRTKTGPQELATWR